MTRRNDNLFIPTKTDQHKLNRCFSKLFHLAIFFVLVVSRSVPAYSDNGKSAQAAGLLNPSVALETCSDDAVRCVGAGQEYSTIQAAANAVKPGDTVLVFDGNYTGHGSQ